jgi:hypothetical protein
VVYLYPRGNRGLFDLSFFLSSTKNHGDWRDLMTQIERYTYELDELVGRDPSISIFETIDNLLQTRP